jgi:hypothetical protein
MCFSFIKKMRGRILQAHFDKNGLIIRKSQIYDFTKPETTQPLVEIFLQFMTCKLVGDTKTALLRWFLSIRDIDIEDEVYISIAFLTQKQFTLFKAIFPEQERIHELLHVMIQTRIMKKPSLTI